MRRVPPAAPLLLLAVLHAGAVRADPLLVPLADRPGSALGQVAGGVVGGAVGYATGLLYPFARSTCVDPDPGPIDASGCGEGIDEGILGAVVLGPLFAVGGAAGGVITARAAARGRDLPVLLAAAGGVAVGQGLTWLALSDEEGGQPLLAALGVGATLVGAPVAATVVGNRTDASVALAPAGPGGAPGVTLAARW